MKKIEKIQTIDGYLFDMVKEAKRHAEKIYGESLTSLSIKLLKQDKYVTMAAFIDANLSAFIELHKLKNDILLYEKEE